MAGNFTSAAALGGLGQPDWGWLFLGAGLFSWLSLESLVILRLSGIPGRCRPPASRSSASSSRRRRCAPWPGWRSNRAPAIVGCSCSGGTACSSCSSAPGPWLRAQPFAPSYWAYTFGVAATALCGLKLALAGAPAAQALAIPICSAPTPFIGYLTARTAWLALRRPWRDRRSGQPG